MRVDLKFSGKDLVLPSGEAIDAVWSNGDPLDFYDKDERIEDGLYEIEISPTPIESFTRYVKRIGHKRVTPNAHIAPRSFGPDKRLIKLDSIRTDKGVSPSRQSYLHSPRWTGHKRGIQIPDHAFARLKAYAAINNKHTLTMKVTRANKAPWMRTAIDEIGVTENTSKTAHNPRILQYYQDIQQGGIKDDDIPWCSTFVSWVMKQSGYSYADVPRLVANPMGSLNWNGYGRGVKIPTFGCIATKKRKTKSGKELGHVTFIVGQSQDGVTLYGLGGNQGNMVQVTPFPKSVFNHFCLPKDYYSNNDYLPIYTGTHSGTVSET